MKYEDLLQVMVAAAPCALIVWDEVGRILLGNEALDRMFG